MTEREELIAWATRNKKDGMGNWRTPDEIASFALMNGFDPILVHQILGDWHQGTGLDIRMRWACGVGSEIAHLERMSPLHDSWRELGKFLTTGQEWGT